MSKEHRAGTVWMGDNELRHLCEMANQIAANFSFHDDQVVRTADHLKRFWAPSMRRSLAAHIDNGGSDVDDAVIEAMKKLRGA